MRYLNGQTDLEKSRISRICSIYTENWLFYSLITLGSVSILTFFVTFFLGKNTSHFVFRNFRYLYGFVFISGFFFKILGASIREEIKECADGNEFDITFFGITMFLLYSFVFIFIMGAGIGILLRAIEIKILS